MMVHLQSCWTVMSCRPERIYRENMEVLALVRITEFKDNYLEQLQEIELLMWIRVQWDGTIARENVIAAVDENDQLLGVCVLSYDGTWYYIDRNRTDIPVYRMQMELSIKEGVMDAAALERALIGAAKDRMGYGIRPGKHQHSLR